MLDTTGALASLRHIAERGNDLTARCHDGFNGYADIAPDTVVAKRRLLTKSLGGEGIVWATSFTCLNEEAIRIAVARKHSPFIGAIAITVRSQKEWFLGEHEKGESQYGSLLLCVSNDNIEVAHELTPLDESMLKEIRRAWWPWGMQLDGSAPPCDKVERYYVKERSGKNKIIQQTLCRYALTMCQ